jgi:hypothetical protein
MHRENHMVKDGVRIQIFGFVNGQNLWQQMIVSRNFLSPEILVGNIADHEKFVQLSCSMISFIA